MYVAKEAGAMALVTGVAGMVAAGWSLPAFGGLITQHVGAPWFVLGAGFGASAAGALVSPALGRGAAKGALLSLMAFFCATLIGAALAGVLMLAPGRMENVLSWLFFTFLTPLALLWLGLWAAVHLVTRQVRARLI